MNWLCAWSTIQVQIQFVEQQCQKSRSCEKYKSPVLPHSSWLRVHEGSHSNPVLTWSSSAFFHLELGNCVSASRSEMKPRNLHIYPVSRSCGCNQSRECRELPSQRLKLLLLLLNKSLRMALPKLLFGFNSCLYVFFFLLCKSPWLNFSSPVDVFLHYFHLGFT